MKFKDRWLLPVPGPPTGDAVEKDTVIALPRLPHDVRMTLRDVSSGEDVSRFPESAFVWDACARGVPEESGG